MRLILIDDVNVLCITLRKTKKLLSKSHIPKIAQKVKKIQEVVLCVVLYLSKFNIPERSHGPKVGSMVP